jgi:hypothetical protein
MTLGTPGGTFIVNISFQRPIGYFGFYMGSPDTYNLIEFYRNGTPIGSFNGGHMIDPADQSWSTGDFINFFIPGGADGVMMWSSGIAFETDNHAFAPIPEPGTWALMGAGLLAAGLIRRKASRG